MPQVITTCPKCSAQYSWNSDFQQYPDCPRCGHNQMKLDRDKWQQCCDAIQRGDAAAVQRFLNDSNVKRNINAGPWTMLHNAVFGGHTELARLLLEEGATPNVAYPQTDKDTPLHSAACRGRHEIAKLLLENRADVDANNAHGKTPLDLARENQDQEMVALIQSYKLESKGHEAEQLQEAASSGDLAKLTHMIENGADVNGRDDRRKRTALHYAAMKGHKDIVAFLLRRKADVNASDRPMYRTPLHWAASEGHLDIVEMLIHSGADVNVADDEKLTPLHCAARNGHTGIVLQLLRHGADPEAKSNYGITPLMGASGGWNKPEVARVIREFTGKWWQFWK
ncbi:MAG: ankyrin repeat domain-containing protein [Planctomycetota bacterium]|nr:ankyrin repeat domain-containing protein [Planctomycetota bacterium]